MLLVLLVVALVSGVALADYPKPCLNCATTPPPAPPQRLGCSPCVLISKSAPAQVLAGEEFEYQILVTSTASEPLQNVVVTDTLADGFRLTGTDPKPFSQAGNKLQWLYPTLQAKETQVIRVMGQAMGEGTLVNCVTVTYELSACLTINVVEPRLALTKTAPAAVLICEQIPLVMVVSNPGSGTVRNVRITDTLPEGLVAMDGSTSLNLNAGDLASGQSKQFTVAVRANRTGTFVNTAVATGEGGLTAQASSTTTVSQPVLTIQKTCKDRMYIGAETDQQITVSNKGDAPAVNTILEDSIVGGTVIAVSDNGTMAGARAMWNLGTLEPGATKTVSVTVRGNTMGKVADTATVRAACAEPVSASCETEIVGIPAVLLEVVDSPDPVPVGGTTTYTITATNQGSAPDSNIKIVATLEAQQDYVSSAGATVGTAAGKTITFAPLPVLGVGQRAVWTVVVKANAVANVRFHLEMNTDQLTRPVNETESTNLYAR